MSHRTGTKPGHHDPRTVIGEDARFLAELSSRNTPAALAPEAVERGGHVWEQQEDGTWLCATCHFGCWHPEEVVPHCADLQASRHGPGMRKVRKDSGSVRRG